MLKMECCLDSLKVKKFCRTELMSPDFDHQMNMIVGPFVATQKKYTPFCDSNHHSEFCCIKMLVHWDNTALQCGNNVATIEKNVATMLHRWAKNRRCESSCVKTPLIFLSTPSHTCEHNFLYLIF